MSDTSRSSGDVDSKLPKLYRMAKLIQDIAWNQDPGPSLYRRKTGYTRVRCQRQNHRLVLKPGIQQGNMGIFIAYHIAARKADTLLDHKPLCLLFHFTLLIITSMIPLQTACSSCITYLAVRI